MAEKKDVKFDSPLFQFQDYSGKWNWAVILAVVILAWVGYDGYKKGWFKLKL